MGTAKHIRNQKTDPETSVPPLVTDGSTLYYVSLNLLDSIKIPLLVLHALHQAISSIPLDCSDPGVAHIKLEWWREEVERINSGMARHPLARQLQSLSQLDGIDTATLMNIITTTEKHILPPEILTADDWYKFIDTGPGLPWKITSRLCGINVTNTIPYVDTIIRYSSWMELLQNFYPLILKNRCYFPEEMLNEHGLDKHALMTTPDSVKVKTLLRNEYENILQQLQNAYKNLPDTDRNTQLALLTLCKLSLVLCREILKSPMPDPRTRTALTPLRKLWIAWWTRLTNR